MLKVIAILLLLFIILVLLLSIPAVQTRLGKYATKKINEDFNTNINIERVGLQFNGDVELKQIYIEDFKQDTLISIDELNTSILSFKKLYDNKLTFGDVDIYGLLLNVKTYEGEEDTNLDVFVDKFDDEKPRSEPSDFLLSTSDITIEDSEFRLSDENKETSEILTFKKLDINATDLVIRGPNVNARVNKLAFLDKRGVEIKSMTTNFSYTLNEMSFDDLQIKTEGSNLGGRLKFKYDRETIRHFEDSVQIDAYFEKSNVTLNELNLFYNEFGNGKISDFSSELSGTLNDLQADKLYLRAPGRSVVNGDFNFKNLFNSESNNFEMHANFRDLSSTYVDLRALLPNVLGNALPSTLDKLGKFSIQGRSKVTSQNIIADIDINTQLGLIYADLELNKIDNIDDASYNGKIICDSFDIGQLINDPMVGEVSLNLDVDGKGFTLEKLNTQVEGSIFSLFYNEYQYSNITVAGNVRNKIFNGKLGIIETNVDLDFNGLVDFSKDIYNYDFVADVRHANFNAMNFCNKR